MKRIITFLLVAVVAISSSYAQQSAKESPGNSSTTTNQPQQPASVAQVPAGPVAQATPVGQVIAHQPEAKILQNHAQPEKPNEQDYKLGVFGIHIKLDSLIALAALLISGFAYWSSRAGVRDANRIASEALQLSKVAYASERASDIQWTSIKLHGSAIGAGKNTVLMQLKNFGKAPAAVVSIDFHDPFRNAKFKVISGITASIGPGDVAQATVSLELPQDMGDRVHFGADKLMIQAFASVKDESSRYSTRAMFEFNAKQEYGFAFIDTLRD